MCGGCSQSPGSKPSQPNHGPKKCDTDLDETPEHRWQGKNVNETVGQINMGELGHEPHLRRYPPSYLAVGQVQVARAGEPTELRRQRTRKIMQLNSRVFVAEIVEFPGIRVWYVMCM